MGLSSSKQGDSPPAESAKPTYDTVAVLQEGDPKSPWRHGQVEEAIFLGARVIVKRCGRTEAWVCATLQGCDYVPHTHAAWTFLDRPGRNDVVMERLSGSLRHLRPELSLSQVARFASHTVAGLQALNTRCNRVHADVAPSNICVRDLHGPAECGILIDFGAALYPATGASPTWKLVGGPSRPAFASIAQHDRCSNSARPSPADDYEALLYCVAWAWLGTLPWESFCDQLYTLTCELDAADSDSERRDACERECATLEAKVRDSKVSFVHELCGFTGATATRIPRCLSTRLGALFKTVLALPRSGAVLFEAGTALCVELEAIAAKAEELDTKRFAAQGHRG